MDDIELRAKRELDSRTKAYRKVFDTDEGKHLLRDLSRFCRANTTTFHENARLSDVMEGRREVWLRVQHHLKLTEEEIWELYR